MFKTKHRRKRSFSDHLHPIKNHPTTSKMTPVPQILMKFLFTTTLIHSLLVGRTMADSDLLPSVPPQLENDLLLPESLQIISNDKLSHQSNSKENMSDIMDIDDRGLTTSGESVTNASDLYANMSFEELMELDIKENPLRDPLSIAIPMTVIYSLILLSGIIGNVSTCAVIYRSSYMHSATNYYLFSLAMSDLLLLISGLPQEIFHIWMKYPYIFGEAFCVIRGLAAETSANATVLTITAFTVERFVAIVLPLLSHKLSQLSRVVRMIGIIWLVAFCLALPQAAQFGLKDHESKHNTSVILIKGAWCTLVREIFPFAFQISICVFFVIPMTIITVLYILIGLKLRRSRRKGPLNPEPRTHARSQSHVIRMLVAVVIGFFCCWGPHHTQRLMALYGSQTKVHSDFFLIVYQGLTHVSGVLYYVSTIINPILYNIMSKRFRGAYKDTMGQLCGRPASRGHHHSRTYSAMSHRSCRMTHYTSNRNNTTSITLNKNSTKGKGAIVNMNSMKVGVDKNVEKCPVDVDIGLCRRVSNPPNSNNVNGNSNGRIITNDSSPTFPCSCSNKEKMLMKTPKTATTILSKSSFVTKTHCSVCGGCNMNENGGGRERGTVTFGFLGKTRNKHVNNLYQNGRSSEEFFSSMDTSMSQMNSSPPEKDLSDEIPMTEISNGKKKYGHTLVPPILVRLDAPKSKPKPSLKAFLRRKKKDKNKDTHPSMLSNSGYVNSKPPCRLSSDPSLPSTYAVTVLDTKGNSKTLLRRPRTGSSGNVVVGIQKNTCRAASYTSVDSGKSINTNTISNSSLQNLEDEYTSEEMAGFMGELNLNLKEPSKQVKI